MSAVAAPLRRAPVRHDAVAGPFGLALLMHALLFAAMTLAVQWRTQPQAPIVAELWSAMPPPVVAEVVPSPPPPRPVPQPQPQPESERPADITLEQKKQPPKQEEKKVEPKKEEKKPEPKKAEAKKDEPRKDERKAEAKKDERKAEARPSPELERLMAQANAQPAPGAATGAAATGPSSTVRGADANYTAQVIGCIRPHLAFAVPEGTSASVYADFRVDLLPDGTVVSVRLMRPSGLPGYDAAAERAILQCNPFPRKREGAIDRTIDVRMRPVEAR
jgi:colicin import membrane protein